MSSDKILALTPREYSLLMKAQVERSYDDLEDMAIMAIFTRQAYHKDGKLGADDLFKRPVDGVTAKKTADDIKDKTEYTMRWLSQFEEFSGKEGVNE